MSKTRLLVLFGGITVEHEVSVISGLQLMKHANPDSYEITPVYIDKRGQWWTGNQLKDITLFHTLDLVEPIGLEPFSLAVHHSQNPFDAAILCFHGRYGESGPIQGVLEVAGIPYQGPGITASALAFDKIFSRMVLEAHRFPQPKYTWFTEHEWQSDQAACLDKVTKLGKVVFIKAANGGSTIGVFKATSQKEVIDAVNHALQFDSRIIAESAITDCIEVNVSVLGDQTSARASVVEQPIKADEFLSYADKYQRGGGKKSGMGSATRRIPAPISNRLTQKLQALALEIFAAFDARGVVRIDFFANPSTEEIFVTELNTIPGSMSFYLWEASGMPYHEMIDELVKIAKSSAARQANKIQSFDSPILKTAAV